MNVPRVLSIAGSDSSGGAGIQADLKTFTALNVYGMTAITAVTAQNTQRVSAVHELPAKLVADQINAVTEDIGVDAVKIGMLANAEIVETVAVAIEQHAFKNVVVDPVMIATSGARLLNDDAVDVLKNRLLPHALIVTPNLPEAEALSGMTIGDGNSLRQAARKIHETGASHVLIKGGHAVGPEVVDVLFDGHEFQEFRSSRIDIKNSHGTGCTLSAAIAAFLARGVDIDKAVESGIEYVQKAISLVYLLDNRIDALNHMHGNSEHL